MAMYGNTPIAFRMFLPVALEPGALVPRDSGVRPMCVVKSVTCCGLPHHVKPLSVQAVERPKWLPFSGLSSTSWKPCPWHSTRSRWSSADPSAAKSSPWQVVENPYVSWWNGPGDKLHRRTSGCRKRVDDGRCSPAVARLAGATHGFVRTKSNRFPRDPSTRSHAILPEAGSVEESHNRSVPGNESVMTAELVGAWRSKRQDQPGKLHRVSGLADILSLVRIALGGHNPRLHSGGVCVHGLRCHFVHTSLSKKRQASNSVMTVRTPNRSVVCSSRCRPCCTLTGLSWTPVLKPKIRFWCSTVTNTGCNSLDSVVVPPKTPKECATRRRHVLWLMHIQPGNGALSFILVLCRQHNTLHWLDGS